MLKCMARIQRAVDGHRDHWRFAVHRLAVQAEANWSPSARITRRQPMRFRRLTKPWNSANGRKAVRSTMCRRANWWEIFGDTNLNALEVAGGTSANQQLKAAVARVDEARATARVARSDLMPSLNFDPEFQPRGVIRPTRIPSFGNITANTFSTPLDLSYEVDLWGRVRRGFPSARADAQASLADYYNVLLTLQADVAQNYFAGCARSTPKSPR
jgi:outer membrane protein TolC